MASSYSTDLKLELMVTGENAGTWGDKTNTNLNLIQQAIAGYEAVALSDGGTVALTMDQAAISNARNMVLKFTGTLTTASTVTIPDGIEKFYIIDLSAVTGVTNLTIKTVSGTGFTAGEAAIVAAYSDGTNLNEIALNTLGGTIGSAQIDDNAITAAKISNNAVTTAKILQSNVTTAKLAASAVTANNIAQSTITQAKLASNSVGADQLISTGVTAAEYTLATVTVDADGRITAASSGSAGGGGFVLKRSVFGPSSGTHTTAADTSQVQAYLMGGGGGGGGGGSHSPQFNLSGGYGGYGLYVTPVSGSTGYPFASGGPGAGQPGQGNVTPPAQSGGNSSFNSLTATGGQGALGWPGVSPGSPGSAPGASVAMNGNTPIFGLVQPAYGGAGGNTNTANGQPGGAGSIAIFEG